MAFKSILVLLFLTLVASSVMGQAPGPSPTRSPLPASPPPVSQPPVTAAPTLPPVSTPSPSLAPKAAPTVAPSSPPAGSPTSTIASPPAPPTALTPGGVPAANAPGPDGTNTTPSGAAAVSAGSLAGFIFVATLLM